MGPSVLSKLSGRMARAVPVVWFLRYTKDSDKMIHSSTSRLILLNFPSPPSLPSQLQVSTSTHHTQMRIEGLEQLHYSQALLPWCHTSCIVILSCNDGMMWPLARSIICSGFSSCCFDRAAWSIIEGRAIMLAAVACTRFQRWWWCGLRRLVNSG